MTRQPGRLAGNPLSSPLLSALLLSALVSGVAGSGAAWANGRFPASTGFSSDRDNNRRLHLRATFGQLLSSDGGQSWRWLCEDAIGYRSGTFDPPVVAEGDRLLIGSPTGLFRSTDFGCDWSAVPALQPYQVTDLAANPKQKDTVYASTAISGMSNGVFASPDGGETFAPLITRDCNTFFLSVKVAPSNPQRLYATAYQDLPTPEADGGPPDAGAPPDVGTADAPGADAGPGAADGSSTADSSSSASDGGPAVSCPMAKPGGPTFTASIFTSANGGKTWSELPFNFMNEKVAAVLAVSPTDPSTLFVRVRSYKASRKRDYLLVSTNGGASFTRIFDAEVLSGFIVEPDGRTLWASAELEGIFRSTDLGKSFPKITDSQRILKNEPAPLDGAPHAACLGLGLSKGEIYVCGQNFVDGAALFRTTDGGKTFSEVFRFDQLCGAVQCPASSSAGVCPELYQGLSTQLFLDAGQAPAACNGPVSDGGTDAAPADDAGRDGGVDGSGSSCAVPASSTANPGAGAGLMLLVLLALGTALVSARSRRRP